MILSQTKESLLEVIFDEDHDFEGLSTPKAHLDTVLASRPLIIRLIVLQVQQRVFPPFPPSLPTPPPALSPAPNRPGGRTARWAERRRVHSCHCFLFPRRRGMPPLFLPGERRLVIFLACDIGPDHLLASGTKDQAVGRLT